MKKTVGTTRRKLTVIDGGRSAGGARRPKQAMTYLFTAYMGFVIGLALVGFVLLFIK